MSADWCCSMLQSSAHKRKTLVAHRDEQCCIGEGVMSHFWLTILTKNQWPMQRTRACGHLCAVHTDERHYWRRKMSNVAVMSHFWLTMVTKNQWPIRRSLPPHVMGPFPGVLQCVAVCCSVLQCVAVCCSVLQRLIRRSLLPHIIGL